MKRTIKAILIFVAILPFLTKPTVPTDSTMMGSSGEGRVIRVPQDYDRLYLAVLAAQNGDQVVVAPGVYEEDILVEEKGITIKSIDPTDPNIVEKTIIKSVKFENAKGAELIGLTIQHKNKTLTWIGIGLGSEVKIMNNNIIDAQIQLGGFTKILIKSNRLTGSSITGEGGGGGYIGKKRTKSTEVTITGNKITDNKPVGGRWGKGRRTIYLDGAIATIADNIITRNGNKEDTESTIGVYESSVTIKNNNIEDNYGPGVVLEEKEEGNCDAEITGNSITSCKATSASGTGIFSTVKGKVMIEKNTIEINEGTGIIIISGNAVIKDNKIIGNKEKGIQVSYSKAIITQNTIIGNEGRSEWYSSWPKSRGGGICVTYGSSPTITNNMFDKNRAEVGGAIYIGGEELSSPIVVDNMFKSNTANQGGAIYVAKGSQILDKMGRPIPPPPRGKKEPNNVYGTGNEANTPDDIYFE